MPQPATMHSTAQNKHWLIAIDFAIDSQTLNAQLLQRFTDHQRVEVIKNVQSSLFMVSDIMNKFIFSEQLSCLVHQI